MTAEKRIALLTNDSDIHSFLSSRIDNLIHFNDYIATITSTMIKKYPVLIIDSAELPVFNEQKIVNSINQISPSTGIVFMSRINDLEYQKIIRNNNRITYYTGFPVDLFMLEKVIENIRSSAERMEMQYE